MWQSTREWMQHAIVAAAIVACGAVLARYWFGRDVAELMRRDSTQHHELARGVVAALEAGSSAASLTGSPRFDGEWRMITYQMAALGLGQLALERPATLDEYLPAIRECVTRLQEPAVTGFGAAAWGRAGLEDLESDRGHAYLGYTNLAFGMLRLLEPDSSIAPLHDHVTRALARRLEATATGIIETYPDESYPADVSAVAASIALYDSATGGDHRALLQRFAALLKARYVEPRSGLMYQTVDARSGQPRGPARASGSSIAAYFLSFVDHELARSIFAAVAEQRASFAGFGGVREYPEHVAGGADIDSGPLFFGVSASASAFALAGAKLYGHPQLFAELVRTATLVGVPRTSGDARRFATGGPLGNAIVLAALTARSER
jgi:hypothetical protein